MEQCTQRIDSIELIINNYILIFFSHFSFLMETKLPNNYHLSNVICPIVLVTESHQKNRTFFKDDSL